MRNIEVQVTLAEPEYSRDDANRAELHCSWIDLQHLLVLASDGVAHCITEALRDESANLVALCKSKAKERYTEALRDAVIEAYRGEFLQPCIVYENWYIPSENETDGGMDICIKGYQDGTEGEIVTGWGYRLSADGYLDCTPWTLADSEVEALQCLLGLIAE